MAKAPIETAVGRTIHGRMDNVVYRSVDGETVLARRPRKTGLPPTDTQLGIRAKFREAAKYAKATLADPVRKQPYVDYAQAHGISNRRLFGLIVRDWWLPPVFGEIDATRYQRQAGGEIRVTVNDDVQVMSVTVKLKRQSDNVVLEQGAATYVGPHWRYVATTEAPADIPLVVEASATDRAENTSTESLGIST